MIRHLNSSFDNAERHRWLMPEGPRLFSLDNADRHRWLTPEGPQHPYIDNAERHRWLMPEGPRHPPQRQGLNPERVVVFPVRLAKSYGSEGRINDLQAASCAGRTTSHGLM